MKLSPLKISHRLRGSAVTRVWLQDGLLYYSGGDNGLYVLDVSDPTEISIVNSDFCYPSDECVLTAGYMFARVYASWLNGWKMLIADVSNPSEIRLIQSVAPWTLPDFEVQGNLAYVPSDPFLVYEISNRPAVRSISVNPESVTLTWDFAPGFVLQRTDSMEHPIWSSVLGSADTTGISLPPSSGNEYFRLASY